MTTEATTQELDPTRHSRKVKIGLALFLLLGAGLALTAVMIKHDNLTRTDAPVARARADIINLESMSRQYMRVTGFLPEEDRGLSALVEARMLTELPKDPWGNPYGYEILDGKARVHSLGADGKPGGEGLDADVYHPDVKR